MRIGTGYDVHRLVPGRPLVLGGIKIPFEKGLLGFSDADVICHAIIDAILGGGSLGDIGSHFPDSDKKWKDASSLMLLTRIKDIIAQNGLGISNIDATLIAEKPKIRPFIPKMIEQIALALSIKKSAVSVKATTTEGLDFSGTGEGMAAQAVVLLVEMSDGRME